MCMGHDHSSSRIESQGQCKNVCATRVSTAKSYEYWLTAVRNSTFLLSRHQLRAITAAGPRPAAAAESSACGRGNAVTGRSDLDPRSRTVFLLQLIFFRTFQRRRIRKSDALKRCWYLYSFWLSCNFSPQTQFNTSHTDLLCFSVRSRRSFAMRLVVADRFLLINNWWVFLVADDVALAWVAGWRDVAAVAIGRHQSALGCRSVRVLFDVERCATWLAVKPLLTVLTSV